jgi:hypothetical protein
MAGNLLVLMCFEAKWRNCLAVAGWFTSFMYINLDGYFKVLIMQRGYLSLSPRAK